MKRTDPEPIALDPPHLRTSKDGRANSRQDLIRKGTSNTRLAPGSRYAAGSEGAPVGPSSFAGHYGQLIISEGLAPIPRALFLYQGTLQLSPQQVWFVSCVLAHKWDEDLPHPSLQEIACHATLGLRQVKKIKTSVVQVGLLEVRPRYGADGEQDANSYDFGLLFDRLEHMMLADPSAPPDELAEEASDGDRGRMERSSRISAAAFTATTGATGATRTAQLTLNAADEKAKDYSFAARFGRILLRRGVATVPRALFTYQSQLGLSPQQMWFIGYILSFQWSTELPYPSLRKMASNTGYSERQIHRIKDSLVCAGYLRVIERRAADGADTTSAYDFTALLKTLNELIRNGRYGAKKRVTGEAGIGQRGEMDIMAGIPSTEHALQAPDQRFPEALTAGGELYVSGGVHSASVEGEPGVSERVNGVSGGGVNSMSVAGVNCMSYEIESDKEESDKEESDKEESDKEEPHQQQVIEIDEAKENAYFALVDVGVIPAIAFELARHTEPEQILDWVRYYLAVLSKQDNLSNPLGVLVSRLRSGEEPPFVPSPGDLQSLRLKLSRYR